VVHTRTRQRLGYAQPATFDHLHVVMISRGRTDDGDQLVHLGALTRLVASPSGALARAPPGADPDEAALPALEPLMGGSLTVIGGTPLGVMLVNTTHVRNVDLVLGQPLYFQDSKPLQLSTERLYDSVFSGLVDCAAAGRAAGRADGRESVGASRKHRKKSCEGEEKTGGPRGCFFPSSSAGRHVSPMEWSPSSLLHLPSPRTRPPCARLPIAIDSIRFYSSTHAAILQCFNVERQGVCSGGGGWGEGAWSRCTPRIIPESKGLPS